MGADTGIEWCDHTFNPWWGCQKVSPGCDHCYAEAPDRRTGGAHWGPHAARRFTSEANWRLPRRWNKRAEAAGRRARVFCASMADVFDNKVPIEWREDLWRLIRATPGLDWLLLTKRPENIAKMLPQQIDFGAAAWAQGPWPNVWLGTTVENQAEADRRIPRLLAAPAAKRFLSCEPLLGPVDLRRWWRNDTPGGSYMHPNGLDWVIAGGESGPSARPMHPDWACDLRDQCAAAGVPFFFKQWGEWRPISEGGEDWYAPLYKPNRAAKEGEDQAALNEAFGQRCMVQNLCVRADGNAVPVDSRMAWLAGTKPMLTFRVGKKAAGAQLDGVRHQAFPDA